MLLCGSISWVPNRRIVVVRPLFPSSNRSCLLYIDHPRDSESSPWECKTLGHAAKRPQGTSRSNGPHTLRHEMPPKIGCVACERDARLGCSTTASDAGLVRRCCARLAGALQCRTFVSSRGGAAVKPPLSVGLLWGSGSLPGLRSSARATRRVRLRTTCHAVSFLGCPGGIGTGQRGKNIAFYTAFGTLRWTLPSGTRATKDDMT